MNALLAHIWDKGLKISKPYKAKGKAHERKVSDFVIGPSLKWT